jgi:hypothetical protein
VDLVDIHVTTDVCELTGCGRSGFHFHWRGRVYRSAFDGSMSPAELDEFDADCATDHEAREASRGRRG